MIVYLQFVMLWSYPSKDNRFEFRLTAVKGMSQCSKMVFEVK